MTTSELLSSYFEFPMFIEKALLIPKGLCWPFEVAYWNPRVGAAKATPPESTGARRAAAVT